jgi:hypothetical protein
VCSDMWKPYLKVIAAEAGVRRQLFLWLDDNYFSRSTTITL